MTDTVDKVRESIQHLENELQVLKGKGDETSRKERLAMREELTGLRKQETHCLQLQGMQCTHLLAPLAVSGIKGAV